MRGRVPVAVTVSEQSEPGQVGFARAVAALRPDWLILQPPAIRNVPETAFVRLFGAVAQAVDLPIAIQNNPVNLDVVLSAASLVTLSSLSYLGLGLSPGTADWGLMVAEERNDLFVSPVAPLAPALAIVITATCLNLIGDWFYERLSSRGATR